MGKLFVGKNDGLTSDCIGLLYGKHRKTIGEYKKKWCPKLGISMDPPTSSSLSAFRWKQMIAQSATGLKAGQKKKKNKMRSRHQRQQQTNNMKQEDEENHGHHEQHHDPQHMMTTMMMDNPVVGGAFPHHHYNHHNGANFNTAKRKRDDDNDDDGDDRSASLAVAEVLADGFKDPIVNNKSIWNSGSIF